MSAHQGRNIGCRLAGGSIALLVVAALALPVAAASAATPGSVVTGASIQVSSYSASARGVTYTVNFRSTNSLASSSTVTLAAPAGTVWPQDTYLIYSVVDDATESNVLATNGASVTGTTLTLTTDAPVAAGDLVTVLVNDVGNPTTSGAKTLDLSTSADSTVLGVPYTLAAKRSVTDASVTLSSLSAGATDVTYSFTFVSPDRLTSQWTTATLSFPSGTLLPAPGDAYQCSTPLYAGAACNGDGVKITGETAKIGIGPAAPGQVFTIVVAGVSSGGAGSKALKLSTNADPEAVTLHATLAATREISHPFLQLSTYAASATGVLWSVGFTSPDRLTGGYSTITLAAPSGTVFPAAGGCDVGYTFVDPDAEIDTTCQTEKVTGSTVVITVPSTTSPGDVVSVEIDGVTNPASGSLEVSTSSDPAVKTLPLTDANATVPAAVNLTSTADRATGVTYGATFALGGNLTNSSTVTLSAAAGTVFPSGACNSGEYLVYDLTTGDSAGGCYTGTPGSTVTISQGLSAGAGDEFAVVANGVGNPSSLTGSQSLGVTTSSGGSASAAYTLTSPTSVSSVVLQRTSTSASAKGGSYIVTFQAANGLAADWTPVTISGPSGTVFPTGNCISGEYTVFDLTTGRSTAACPPGTSGSSATIVPGTGDGFWAARGDVVTVVANGVTNPTTAGNDKLKVWTGGDPVAVSVADTIAAESAVKSLALVLSSNFALASGVTYSVSFETTNALAGGWTALTLVFPSGTGLSDAGFTVYDDSTGISSGSGAQITGTTAVLTVPASAAAGDELTIIVTPVTNAGAGSKKLKLSTGSDPKITKVGFTLS